MKLRDYIAKKISDPEFAKEYEGSRPKINAIRLFIGSGAFQHLVKKRHPGKTDISKKEINESEIRTEEPDIISEARFLEIMTEECDKLPDDFFNDLHGGVIMSDKLKISPYARNNDLIIAGEYSRSSKGNQITLYYGSFIKMYPGLSEDELRIKIREVIRHEFRHHLENLAGMHGADSLEREDEIQIRNYLQNRKRSN